MPEASPRAAELRIAYFISSYGSGEQLLRLVRTIRRGEPDSPIVIHHDEFGRTPLDRTPFDALGVTVIGGVERIGWGDMSLEAARWRVLRWIADHLEVDWVMLLSEQDYPIAPFSRLRAQLASSGADAIVSAKRVDEDPHDPERREAKRRYYFQYQALPLPDPTRRVRLSGRVADVVRRGALRLLPHSRLFNAYPGSVALGIPDRVGIRSRKLFSRGYPCWVNECWFPISMPGVRAVLDHVDSHPELVRYYRRTMIPLESATATILFNHPGLRVENRATVAVRWSDPVSGRPDVLTMDDLPFLLDSDACFTRKVDLRHTDLLDALDHIVLSAAEESA